MRSARLVGGFVAAALVAVACAGPDTPDSPSPPAAETGDDGDSGEDGNEVHVDDEASSNIDDDIDDDTALPGPPPAPATPAAVDLSGNEVLPNAKRLASEIVQLLTTYDPDDRGEDVAARIADDDHAIDELLRAIAPLYHEGAWSRGEIVYPQLGGATETDGSVMVVVRQTVGLPDGSTLEHTRTVDVRLTIVDGEWVFAGIEDAGGDPIPRPDDLPPEAVAVLDDERIELPDSAVWDIHAGRTDLQLLRVMSDLAERHSYGVVVLETGHPVFIFDTDRISTHLYGIAVDVYHLDGELVVDHREEGSLVHDAAQWLYEHDEVTNLGSPWALDGFGGRSFTDLVHQDHFHIEAGERLDGPPPHREDLVDVEADTDT